MLIRIASAVVAVSVSGCSLALMRTDPPPYYREPDCTASLAPPALDVAGVVLTGLLAVGLVTVTINSEDSGDGPLYAAGVLATASVVHVVSAVVGFSRASRCRDAKDDWAARPKPVPQVAPPPVVEAIAAQDPLARELTIQAHFAAKQGTCAPISAASAKVRELDPEYHAKVFVIDPAIASCLAR